jgi:hypothetical protein
LFGSIPVRGLLGSITRHGFIARTLACVGRKRRSFSECYGQSF